MGRKFQIFICLFLVCELQFCRPQKAQTEDSQDPLVAFLLNTQPGVQGSCQRFFSSELTCVNTTDSTILSCNDTELTRWRNLISPSDNRNDTNLTYFFDCFLSCNVTFNTSSNCTKTSFASVSDYRTSQRNPQTDAFRSAAALWSTCMDSCRRVNGRVPPTSSPLSNLNITFTADPFAASTSANTGSGTGTSGGNRINSNWLLEPKK